MLLQTLFKVSSLSPRTSATILTFSSSVESMGVKYFFDLRCSHKEKSNGFRLEDHVGQEARISFSIQLFGHSVFK